MIEENELPKGWAQTTLGEICSKPQYGWTTKANHREGLIKLLRTTDISGGFIDWDMVPYCTEIPENLDAYKLTKGDIVISRAGSVGVSYLLSLVPMETVFASYLIRFRPYPQIEPRYMAYYLQTSTYWKSVYEQSSGIALANVNASKLEKFEIPLAPLSEQQRIVTAIEQQFTRLDAAVTALQHTKTKLKRYRAAVLKAAVEGKLTEAWRAEHPATEPASALLERILVERRAKWEADQRAKGKDSGKVKYVEPAMPDVENWPELPGGWCWTTVEQVGDVGTGATPLRGRLEYYDHGTIPWITSGALNAEVVTQAEQLITERALKETNVKVFPKGTLLLAMYGEGKTRGKVSELQIEAATNQACAAIVFNSASIKCQPYIKYFLLSNYLEIRRLSVGGVQPNLNLTIVKETYIPLPPIAEQQQIVSEVERRLSIVTALEATVKANLKRAERLRQSILKEAFAGRLVSQDPRDEPASVLLECIQKEREGQKRGPGKKVRQAKTITAPRVPDIEPVDIDASGMEQMDLWAGIGRRE